MLFPNTHGPEVLGSVSSKQGKCTDILAAGIECVLIPFVVNKSSFFFNFLACESSYLNFGITISMRLKLLSP